MKSVKLIRFVMGALALSAALSLSAQDEQAGRGPGRGDAGERVAAIVQQLDLSAEQQDQVKAVMAEAKTAREAVLAKHGIEMGEGKRPDRDAMQAAAPELREGAQATVAKITAILTPEQLAKFKELRKEGGRMGGGAGQRNKGEDGQRKKVKSE